MPKKLTKIQKIWRKIRKKCRQAWYFIKHRVFRLSETMAVRHDFCRSRKPKLTIVFIHGIASSYDAWRDTVKILEQDVELKDVRFVGIDLMGFGHSPRPKKFKYDYDNYRKALSRTLKKLKIKTPIMLAGHSMGCLISMDYSLLGSRKIDHLILVSPPIFRKNEIGGIADRFYHKAYTDLENHAGDAIVQQIAHIVDFLSSFDQKTLNTPAFKQSMDNLILNDQNWRRIFAVKTPTDAIHGRFDPLIIGENLRIAATRNRKITLTETVGAHDISALKQKRVVAIIKARCLEALKSGTK